MSTRVEVPPLPRWATFLRTCSPSITLDVEKRSSVPNVVPPSSSDESLLERLFDLPAIDRLAHWQKACADNPDLRTRLPEITRILEQSDSSAPTSALARLPP